MPAAIGEKGGVPFAICVPGKWSFSKENVGVTKAYPLFGGYVENQDNNIDWYDNPTEGQTLSVE